MATILNALSDAGLADLLQKGGVGVLPTDTVYGLVCRAADQSAAARLYSLKSRENKPGTLIAANVDQLVELGIKARYLKAVEHYWPNPISVVIPSYDLNYIHLGAGSIAVRIPAAKALTELLEQTGPLLTTSANAPGKPEAKTLQEAQKYFSNKVDFYVEGGNLENRKPSTIIRIVDDAVEVLRQGAVKIDESGRLVQ